MAKSDGQAKLEKTLEDHSVVTKYAKEVLEMLSSEDGHEEMKEFSETVGKVKAYVDAGKENTSRGING